jgi:hypothetical protein
MSDNTLLQWTVDAKRALQQAEQLSSHASVLVRQTVRSLDWSCAAVPKCVFLTEALRTQAAVLQKLGQGCFAVEGQARRQFEVCWFGRRRG